MTYRCISPDQMEDKPHWPSATYRVTRTGYKYNFIINVTYSNGRGKYINTSVFDL